MSDSSSTAFVSGSRPLRGVPIIDAVKAAGVRTIVALPDIVTSDALLWPMSRDPDFRLVKVCKEDEGVSICAGLSFCNHRALLLIQQTGLMDSLNAVRAIAVEYELPICMMVGLQGAELDRLPSASEKVGVRVIEPLLDLLGVGHTLLDTDADVGKVTEAIDRAYASSRPYAFLIRELDP